MKALFSRKNKPVYADHLSDLSNLSHPYYPQSTQDSEQGTTQRSSRFSHRQDTNRRSDDYGPARTTLDALQIIRRRFEAAAKNESIEDQAAA